jgi:transcriptional regulator with AAA-type ATPase domain
LARCTFAEDPGISRPTVGGDFSFYLFRSGKRTQRARYDKKKIVIKNTMDDSLEALVGRSNESEMIWNTLTTALETKSSGSLYIYGKPGTGKTLTAENVIKDI